MNYLKAQLEKLIDSQIDSLTYAHKISSQNEDE